MRGFFASLRMAAEGLNMTEPVPSTIPLKSIYETPGAEVSGGNGKNYELSTTNYEQ
jgi:hypothetical protein